ncbi:MAG: hypothetical protein JO214_00665 [Frankiaceae bacterium]|nr:hypothetical protein [Frankiaceae bacterium]
MDELHLEELDGVIRPQPWMQWRQVRSSEVASRSGSYAVNRAGSTGPLGGGIDVFGTIGSLFSGMLSSLPTMFGAMSILAQADPNGSAQGNKNDLLHSLQLEWTNGSPIPQWVYGKITHGGQRVTLQARSRGGLTLRSGYSLNTPGNAGPLEIASMLGVGADMARSGTLAVNTSFGIIEERQPSGTIPLAPERTGWAKLAPGDTITARAELRFVSEFWEATQIDGGTSGTESSYETGGLRLDLFAVPVI